MRIVKLLVHLSIVFNIFALLSPGSAIAETVKMVTDLDQQSRWKMHSSVSNDRVAFHFRTANSVEIPTLWRSTNTETVEVDLSAIRTNGAGVGDYHFTLTDNFLYVWNGHQELWQIGVDSLQARQVRLDSLSTSEDYSDVIRDQANGAFYFLIKDSGRLVEERGLRLYKLDEDAPAINLVSPAVIAEGFSFRNNIVLGKHILFHGRSGIWKISTTGENPQNISNAKITDNTRMVAAKSIVYFHVVNLRRSPNDIVSCNIWRTDGTKRGTYSLTSCDIGKPNPPPNSYPAYGDYDQNRVDPEITVTRNNQAVFKKVNWRSNRIEIWKTNGTRASTRQVKSFPYVRVSGNVNPESMKIDLRRAGKYIWYKSYARNRRQTVSVSDLSLENTKRIMAGRPNAVINLMGFSDHVLIQQVYNSANFNNISSALYRADANGDALSRISYGRSFHPGSFNDIPVFRVDRLVVVANQVLLPYKPLKQSRELLLAHNLDSGVTSVRQRWPETTDSASRGSYLTPGPRNTVWFCANNGDAFRWKSGSQSRLWTTDGTSENTRAVMANVGSRYSLSRDSNIVRSECGQFVISENRVVFVRRTASLGEELWTARLDGSEQKPLLDLRSGKKSSFPRQLVATNRGVIFTAFPETAFLNREEHWNPKQLVRVNRSGRHEVLFNGSQIRILGKINDNIWFRTFSQLGVTDGTAAGTRVVMNRIKGAKVAEIDGTTYLVISHRRNGANNQIPPGLFKLTANATDPVLVSELEPQGLFSVAEPVQILAHKGYIYVLKGRSFAQWIYRYDPSTGDAQKIVDLNDSGNPTLRWIESIAVLDDSIYAYVNRSNIDDSAFEQNWEIWRSSGEPDDFVKVHAQSAIGDAISGNADYRLGQLKAFGSSVWFMARDQVHGIELWQLKSD